MITFNDVITNKLLIAVLLTIVVGQVIKAITNAVKGKKFSMETLFYGTGGMPSSHAAVVTCLTVSILLLEGISYLFVASVVFSLIIIRDAVGVRWATGEQAKVINDMQAKLWKNKSKIVDLKESIGHTPAEVIVGIILGLVIAFLTVYLL
ncbi:divergent PAP2 family protein [Candidatus Woesearchaeota archaeon]|nr:divergent PAP2 family protein [Candidatus Woesearchaeota archaeon]